jgi:hypothetical protein
VKGRQNNRVADSIYYSFYHDKNVTVNTLGEDIDASSNSDESEMAEELSIRVDDGQCSDICSVAGDDINQISPTVIHGIGTCFKFYTLDI